MNKRQEREAILLRRDPMGLIRHELQRANRCFARAQEEKEDEKKMVELLGRSRKAHQKAEEVAARFDEKSLKVCLGPKQYLLLTTPWKEWKSKWKEWHVKKDKTSHKQEIERLEREKEQLHQRCHQLDRIACKALELYYGEKILQ